ncbi:MAG: hypothetical protein ABI193_19575 [Minicystis sp.]
MDRTSLLDALRALSPEQFERLLAFIPAEVAAPQAACDELVDRLEGLGRLPDLERWLAAVLALREGRFQRYRSQETIDALRETVVQLALAGSREALLAASTRPLLPVSPTVRIPPPGSRPISPR